jgi:hypothetical protein
MIALLMRAQAEEEAFGLAGFFYLPYSFFVSEYGHE